MGVKMKLESLSFRDRFDILLEKRLSGVTELTDIMVYGKSQRKGLLRWTSESAIHPEFMQGSHLFVCFGTFSLFLCPRSW